MREHNTFFSEQFIHIIGYDFRISGDNRTVIVVLSFIVLFLFIIDARIEYPFLAHLYEGLDVAVNHLSRITSSI